MQQHGGSSVQNALCTPCCHQALQQSRKKTSSPVCHVSPQPHPTPTACPPRPGCRTKTIALTFGPGHTCGRRPERVANVMKAFVAKQSGLYPECFGGEAPPPLLGSWANPHIIQAIPFTSDLFSVSTLCELVWAALQRGLSATCPVHGRLGPRPAVPRQVCPCGNLFRCLPAPNCHRCSIPQARPPCATTAHRKAGLQSRPWFSSECRFAPPPRRLPQLCGCLPSGHAG